MCSDAAQQNELPQIMDECRHVQCIMFQVMRIMLSVNNADITDNDDNLQYVNIF